MSDDEKSESGLHIPFWIDTDGYSDRDRNMFTCGFEFCLIVAALEAGEEVRRPIHRENESRIRMLCGKFKRRYELIPHEGYSGCETWSDLLIEAKS